MAGEWRIGTLREALGEKGYIRGPFGSALRRPELKSSGVPVYEQQHAITGTREFRFYIDKDKHKSLKRFTVQPHDLIISCSGTLGRVSMIRPEDPTGIISQALLILRPDQAVVWPKYLYYFMSSKRGYDSLVGVSTGSVQVNIAGRSIIEKTELPLPPIDEQRAIAAVLGALDDKIELNRRMCRTLEGIARAIFQAWFVDFLPVKAKAAGARRFRGMPQAVFDTLPTQFVDSPLGPIPKGWRACAIHELVDCVKGTSYRSDELAESDTALVTLKSFARGGGYRPDGLKAYTGAYKPEQVVRVGELVVACTDVTQAAEVIGRPALVRASSRYATFVASLDTVIVRPRGGAVSVAFLYCLFLTESFAAHTYAHSTGTTVLHLAKEAVPSYMFVLPAQALMDGFNVVAQPMFQRIDAIDRKIVTLAAIRDALLPKLVSGEIRIKDAERIIGRCA